MNSFTVTHCFYFTTQTKYYPPLTNTYSVCYMAHHTTNAPNRLIVVRHAGHVYQHTLYIFSHFHKLVRIRLVLLKSKAIQMASE